MKFRLSVLGKRILFAAIFGALFGVLCTYLASTQNSDIWGTALMWGIIFNRFLIGFVIGVAGYVKYHPCLGFKIPVCLRGAFFGALVSLDSAIGAFIAPETASATGMTPIGIFWSTIIAGIIYGVIIDLVVTKFVGDGEKLLVGICKSAT